MVTAITHWWLQAGGADVIFVGFIVAAVLAAVVQFFLRRRDRTANREVICVSHREANNLIRDGWRLAIPEEDNNKDFRVVYLERRKDK